MTMRPPAPHRRGFLLGSALAAGAASPALAAGAGLLGAPAVALFDPVQPAAKAFAAERQAGGALPVPVEGDRIRLARRLFRAHGPRSAVAMTTFADFLLLSGSAREHGYRTSLLDRAPSAGGTLFVWTAEKA